MSAAADRHLLFGLLALQNGLIQQDAARCRVSCLDAATSHDRLADHLVAPRRPRRRERSVVEALAALHVQAHGDDVERSLAAVPAGKSDPREPGAARRPGRRGDPRPRRLGTGTTRPRTPTPTEPAATPSARPPPTASGSASCGRTPGAGSGRCSSPSTPSSTARSRSSRSSTTTPTIPTSRTRFVLEAEITGGLEHPGIVPVYGLGSYADGRPFYAMRFIRGDSLKEAIAAFHADETLKNDPGRRSLELRKLLRRFVDVCNAIDYAHSRGVLHRDLKPANVMVGKYGETLVVDWGLAKAMGKAEPGSTVRRADADAELGQRLGRDAARLGDRHAGVHEPRAGRRRPRPARAASGRLQPGRDALLPADRQAAVRGGRPWRRPAGASPRGTSHRRESSTRRSTVRWRRSA